jgi:hypothetical protein
MRSRENDIKGVLKETDCEKRRYLRMYPIRSKINLERERERERERQAANKTIQLEYIDTYDRIHILCNNVYR